jgi:hypothetical protein
MKDVNLTIASCLRVVAWHRVWSENSMACGTLLLGAWRSRPGSETSWKSIGRLNFEITVRAVRSQAVPRIIVHAVLRLLSEPHVILRVQG